MSRPLHVCHLIKGLGRGGAERLLAQTMRAGGDGFRYSVAYFLPGKDHLVAELEDAGATVRCFPARSTAALAARVPGLARWWRRRQVDLVHAHLPLSAVAGRLAAALARLPLVYTEHNLLERYHPLTRYADLATWRLQRRVIAVSREVADSIARHAGDRVPVQVVHNGIEIPDAAGLDHGRRRLRAELGLADNVPVVVTVAVFRRQKRLDLWLEAAARVAAQRPDCHFLLVGDGPLRSDVEQLAQRPELLGRVILPGLQEDVVPYLAAGDVFLSTSRFEGLPLALLEAMAARLPVVATAVGGVPEVVTDGEDGRLIPFGDIESAAAAVLDLLHQPDRARRLAEAGRARVERGFSVARMARELETVYREVLRREVS